MIFYFLKELVASPSRLGLYFFTSCVVIKLSFFVRQNRSDFFVLLLAFFRLLSLFCYSLTSVNFLSCFAAKIALAFPFISLRVSAFSFLRFGSAKV
jgi:hypothetical protein